MCDSILKLKLVLHGKFSVQFEYQFELISGFSFNQNILNFLADVSYESSGIDDSESGDSSSKNYAHHSYHSDNSIEEYDTEDHYGGYHNENYKYDDSRAKDTKPGSLAIGSINTQNSGTEGAYALPNYGEEGGMDESKNSEIESHIHPGILSL